MCAAFLSALQFSCYLKKGSERFHCVDGARCALPLYPTSLCGILSELSRSARDVRSPWSSPLLSAIGVVNPEVGGGTGVTGDAPGCGCGALSAAVGDWRCLGTGNPALSCEQPPEGSGVFYQVPKYILQRDLVSALQGKMGW